MVNELAVALSSLKFRIFSGNVVVLMIVGSLSVLLPSSATHKAVREMS